MSISQAELVSLAEREPGVLSLLIQRHRTKLSNHIVNRCNGVVIRGPFAGMILPPSSGSWGDADRASMALGLYEQEILDLILKVAPRGCTFVNLGAADGYYGIGMLTSGIAAHAHCFELDPVARQKLLATSAINNVANKISVYGRADSSFYLSIGSFKSETLFVLCDVEGAEFEIFSSKDVFQDLQKSHIVIEIHDWDDSLKMKTQELVSLASHSHRPSFFSTGSRDLSGIECVQSLDDTNRWLICSEGRPKMMQWCHLSPIFG
jgi:hypothetical protein